MKGIKLKIIETKKEALEAYKLYTNVHLKINPYYTELSKNPNYNVNPNIFYNYHTHNVNRLISQKLSVIADDTTVDKVVSFVCVEDLFEEPNPDYPVDKPSFIKLGKDIYNKSLDRFIKEGKVKKSKGDYLSFSKVATDENFRGQGLNSSLFHFAEEVGRDRGFKYIYLDPAHPKIIKFVMEKLKYPEIGRLYYRDIEYEGTYPYKGTALYDENSFICYGLKALI
jgi:GNAT superfamily N-acetyltransferase